MSSRRSVVFFLVVFAFMSLFPLLGRGAWLQPSNYKVSGKMTGGPAIVSSRSYGYLYASLQLTETAGHDEEHNPGRVTSRVARVNGDGSFEFADVPPGTYILLAYPATAALKSFPTITVTDRDVTGVEVQLVLTDVVTSRENLEPAWSLPGYWSGVAAAVTDGTIYVAVPSAGAATMPMFAKEMLPGHIREIDFNGQVRSQISIPGFRSAKLVVAHLFGSSEPAFLMSGVPINKGALADVHVFSKNGDLLWSHPEKQGASDVAVMDPAENNLNDVIVGYVAGTGLHVLDSQGKLRWKSNVLWNVFDVAAGDVRGEGKPQVLTTSESGRVHIFNTEGVLLADLDAGTHATMVCLGKLSESTRTATIFAMGAKPTDSAVTVTSLSGAGKTNWSVQLPSKVSPPTVYSASLASAKPWLAVGMGDGQVFVVDAWQGSIVGRIDGQSVFPEIAWVGGRMDTPRLVVSTKTALHAYTVSVR